MSWISPSAKVRSTSRDLSALEHVIVMRSDAAVDEATIRLDDLRARSGEVSLDDYHFLNLTGGFLDGDDLGSAKAQANRLKNATVAGSGEKLVEQFTRFIDGGKPAFTGMFEADTGLKFLDKETITPYVNTKSRFEGTSTAAKVIA